MQILAYHKIGPKFDLSVVYQSQKQFSGQLKFLQAEGYRFVSLEEAFQKSFPEKALALTFDDGYENIYTTAFPVLQELDIPATAFMVTGFVGKYNSWDFNFGRKGLKHLSWEQIKEMAKDGISFGSHTVNHPDLTKLDKKYVDYELKTSKEILEDKLGQEVKFLSYPFGKYNSFIKARACEFGYKKAFTLYSDGSSNNSDSYAIKRIGVYRFDTPLSLKIKLEGGFWCRLEDLKGNLINRLSYGTSIVKPKPKYGTLN
ncbi:MAG: hypothetical protein A2145_02200 [candidate division Zixibacteria bacterium RBG_16_40_9]|nr:MAG: hypothetical protein A2145_02200 [candidate division Zixibacteria bacterium RBG_16_40_9]